MITLTILNEQADAVLPELQAARDACAEKLRTATGEGAESRTTQALSVLGALCGQIVQHQAEGKRPRRSTSTGGEE